MTEITGADALTLHSKLYLDARTNGASIVSAAFQISQIDGSQPFVSNWVLERGSTAEELLPADAVIVRSTDNEYATEMLARTADASIHLALRRPEVAVAVASADPTTTRAILDSIKARAPEVIEPDTVGLWTWHTHMDSFHKNHRPIGAPSWDEIERNYPKAVRGQLAQLAALVRPAQSGKLILWHGPPGTGKTTALRAVMRAWSSWCTPHYIADPERFFANPGYITEVVGLNTVGDMRSNRPYQLIIAEDCDEYLRASARRDAGAALGRLLNLADGVLGQGYDTLILLTTNEDLRRLHPALTRPGRCLANVQFAPFTCGEAVEWLPDECTPPRDAITLAELYEWRGDLSTIGHHTPPATTGQYL